MSILNAYICRLCLCSGGRLIDIYKDNDFLEFVVQDVIEDLLNVQVKRLEGFPWLICSSCLGKLTEFRFFKIRCLECKVTFESRFTDFENSTGVFLGSDSSGISSPCNWYNESPTSYFTKEGIKSEDSHGDQPFPDVQGAVAGGALVANCASEPVFLKREPEDDESEDGQYVNRRLGGEVGGNNHASVAQGGTQMARNGVSSSTTSSVPSPQTCQQQGGRGSSTGRGWGRRAAAAGKQCSGHGTEVGLVPCDICDEHSEKGCCGVISQGYGGAIAADSEDDNVWLSGPKRKRAALQRWYWELEKLRSKTEKAKRDAESAAVMLLRGGELLRKGDSPLQSSESRNSPVEGQWFGGMPKIVNVSCSTTMKTYRGRTRRMAPTAVGSSFGTSGKGSTVAHEDVRGSGESIGDDDGMVGGVLKGCGSADEKADVGSAGELILGFSEALKKVKVALTDQESKSFPRLGAKGVVHTVPPQDSRGGKEVGIMRKVECKSIVAKTKDVTISVKGDIGTKAIPRGNPDGERVLVTVKQSKCNGVDEMEDERSRGVSKIMTKAAPHKPVRASMGTNQMTSHSLPEAVHRSKSASLGGEMKKPASASCTVTCVNKSLADSVTCPSVSSSRGERAGVYKKARMDSAVKGEGKEFKRVEKDCCKEHDGLSVISNENSNLGARPFFAVKSGPSDLPANMSAAVESEGLSCNSVRGENFPSANHVVSSCSQPSFGELAVEAVEEVGTSLGLAESDRLAQDEGQDLTGITRNSPQTEPGDGVVVERGTVLVEQTEGLATVLLENKVGTSASVAIGSVGGGDSKPSSSALIREDAEESGTSVVVAGGKCGTEMEVNRSVLPGRSFLNVKGCGRNAGVSEGGEEADHEVAGPEASERRVLRPRAKSGRFSKREKRFFGRNSGRPVREVPQDAKDKKTDSLDCSGEGKDC